MKKLIFIPAFFFLVCLTFGLSLFALSSEASKSTVKNPPPVLGTSAQQNEDNPVFVLPQITLEAGVEDARPILVKNYLARYNSVLTPHYQKMVNVADKYELDYRLLVAIAQQESNLCKRIPPNSYNCWGFGIYADKVTRFDSFEQAFEIVARTLKKNYIDQGLKTPEEIMAKYTPPSVEIGGPWAKGVNQFMKAME